MTLEAALLHDVVLAGCRTPVRVRARGVGRLRVGDDVALWVWGAFEGVVLARAAPVIDVRFGRARRALAAAVVAAPRPPRLDAVRVDAPVPAVDVPRPRFRVTVRLPREEPSRE